MDSRNGADWQTSTWWHDDISTSELDNHWWATTQTMDGTSQSAGDEFRLSPAIDSYYYGLDGAGAAFSLPSEAAMADSPSFFGSVDDDESMMSPPITPSISMAYPSPRASPSSDYSTTYDTVKTKTKSARTTSSKTRTSGSATKSSSRSARKPSTLDSSNDPKLQRARTCHNVVEKNYRNRLNGQFELMLATLDKSQARTGQRASEMEGFDRDSDRAPSKSAVLQLARERLISLERENASLRYEVERLRDTSQTEFSYARTALV